MCSCQLNVRTSNLIETEFWGGRLAHTRLIDSLGVVQICCRDTMLLCSETDWGGLAGAPTASLKDMN